MKKILLCFLLCIALLTGCVGEVPKKDSAQTAHVHEQAAALLGDMLAGNLSFAFPQNDLQPVTQLAKTTTTKKTTTKKTTAKNTDIVNYKVRPSYYSVERQMKALAEKYPKLISTEVIGKSVQGRKITAMKLGKGKNKALAVAGFHAREHITVSYLMRCAEEFAKAYHTKDGKFSGYYMKSLFNTYTLYLVPLVNPDGLQIVRGSAKPSVKVNYPIDPATGKRLTLSDYKANANGVNLNKNFPFYWKTVKTKRTSPDPENYKGKSAASEPETKALMNLCDKNKFLWMASFHARGDCIYWSDAKNKSVGLSKTMVNYLDERCGFYKCPTSKDINGYGGGFENWFRHTYKKPGFCIELMPLKYKISALNSKNQLNFDNTVRWKSTRKVLPIMMVFGRVKK